MILPNQKSQFSIPAGVTYLNCSSMSPLLNRAHLAAIAAADQCRTPWVFRSENWFNPAEEIRELVGSVIHASKDNIALVPSVSYGMAIAANNITLTPNQKIIILEEEYPSNVYVWCELSERTGAPVITVKRQGSQSWTEAVLENIHADTGLVTLPNGHWTDGSILDLEAISKKVKAVNAYLVIDGSQSVGAYPIDVEKIKPDFLATVGYKWLLGPYGLAYLYADDKYCQTGKPLEYSWMVKKGAEDFTALVKYQDEYKPGARRFDAGEFSGFINIPIAREGLKQLLTWGVENIQETLSVITGAIEERARTAGLKAPGRNTRVGHIIGIDFAGSDIKALGKKLNDHNIHISFRGTKMRIAPHLYNDLEDVNRLFESL